MFQGSYDDSGKGASPSPREAYQFIIRKELVGKLIGKKGSFVNAVYTKTDVELIVHSLPYSVYGDVKIGILTGTPENISKAKKMLERRFPNESFPELVRFEKQSSSSLENLPPPQSVSKIFISSIILYFI